MVLVLISALPVWYFCIYAPPLKISPETTYITAPLMSDGKRIDYFRAIEERLYPPEMKTDENGYRMLMRSIGDLNEYREFGKSILTMRDLDPEPFRIQVYEKLGLDPTIPPTMKLESAWTFIDRYVKEHPEEKKQTRERFSKPWTFDDLPMLKDWLDENEAGIDMLVEAVHKPVFYAPMVRKSEDEPLVTRSGAHDFREFARAIQARAMYRVGIGNIDGAIDDIIAGYWLARHVGKHGTLVECLVGIAFEGMAVSIPIGGNPAVLPSQEQLQRLLDAIHSLPPLQKLEDCFEMERLSMLGILQEYALGKKVDMFGVPESGLWCAGVDWNFVFREVNDAFNSIIAGRNVEEPIAHIGENILFGKGRQPSVKLTVRERTKLVRDTFVSFVSPLQSAREAENRRQCFENMKLLTLALLLYQHEHGQMPNENWTAQIEKYLSENPEKYFSCPTNPSPNGETTYALVQHGEELPTNPDTILLVELKDPVPLDKAVISVDEVLARQRTGSSHPGGMNVALRSGAVRFLSSSTGEKELLRMLGRETQLPGVDSQ